MVRTVIKKLKKGPILRGVAKHSDDGWKGNTKRGDVVFVYGTYLLPPYAPGQYTRVGNPIWSVSEKQFEFSPAGILDKLKLLPLIWKDLRSNF